MTPVTHPRQDPWSPTLVEGPEWVTLFLVGMTWGQRAPPVLVGADSWWQDVVVPQVVVLLESGQIPCFYLPRPSEGWVGLTGRGYRGLVGHFMMGLCCHYS